MMSMSRQQSYSRILLMTGALFASNALAQEQAEYRFEFIAEWSQETHPTSFPNNPHFSPVIGANHTADFVLWEPNAIASNGIERMAETGSNTVLTSELSAAIGFGLAEQVLTLGSISSSPGNLNRNFIVHRDYPLLSLVAMIAPSPDWFVGIHDVNLRPDGVWAQDLIFDLYAYDSGTDAGTNYNSSNADITPHLPIENISDIFPFTGTTRIGTFHLTLESEASCSLADLAEPFGDLNFFDVSVFLNAFASGDLSADLNADGDLNFFDVSEFLSIYTQGCP